MLTNGLELGTIEDCILFSSGGVDPGGAGGLGGNGVSTEP